MKMCSIALYVTFESVDEILWCDHSSETSYLGVLSTDKVLQLHNLVINTGAVTLFNQIMSRTLFGFNPSLTL